MVGLVVGVVAGMCLGLEGLDMEEVLPLGLEASPLVQKVGGLPLVVPWEVLVAQDVLLEVPFPWVEVHPLEAFPLEALPFEAPPLEALALPLEAPPLEGLPLDALPLEALPFEAHPLEGPLVAFHNVAVVAALCGAAVGA